MARAARVRIQYVRVARLARPGTRPPSHVCSCRACACCEPLFCLRSLSWRILTVVARFTTDGARRWSGDCRLDSGEWIGITDFVPLLPRLRSSVEGSGTLSRPLSRRLQRAVPAPRDIPLEFLSCKTVLGKLANYHVDIHIFGLSILCSCWAVHARGRDMERTVVDMESAPVTGASSTTPERVHTAPLNPLVSPLLTDINQVAMAIGHYQNGRAELRATFELFFRRNPFGGEYTVFAGLEECIKLLASFKFTQEQITYLKGVPMFSQVDSGFWEWLAGVDCSTVKVHACAEGTIVFPRIPLLLLEGPQALLLLLETPLLNAVNYPSLVATNATRFRVSAGADARLYEFGLRRAQGPDGGTSASRYAHMGGFDATSNALAGHLCDIPLHGTMGHAFIQAFTSRHDLKTTLLVGPPPQKQEFDFLSLVLALRDELGWGNTNEGELVAFMSYAQAFPTTFLALVDSYDTIKSGVRNFLIVALCLLRVGYRPIGIRLDSGDLAYLSKVARAEFGDFSVRMVSEGGLLVPSPRTATDRPEFSTETHTPHIHTHSHSLRTRPRARTPLQGLASAPTWPPAGAGCQFPQADDRRVEQHQRADTALAAAARP